jgi:hypothetical protein
MAGLKRGGATYQARPGGLAIELALVGYLLHHDEMGDVEWAMAMGSDEFERAMDAQEQQGQERREALVFLRPSFFEPASGPQKWFVPGPKYVL